MPNGQEHYWTASALNERFARLDRDLAGDRRRMELIEDATDAMRDMPASIARAMLAHEQRMTDQIEKLREDFREDIRDQLSAVDRIAGLNKWKVGQVLVALGVLAAIAGVLLKVWGA